MASVPHFLLSAPAPAQAIDPERLRRRRSMRLRMQSLIAVSYGVDAALLLLFHQAGTVPGWVPAAYLAVAIVACGLFFALLASSWPNSREDQNLTGIQIPVAAAIQLGFLLLVPQLGFFFLSILFIVFAFGALRLDPKEALFAWIAMAAGLGVVLWNVRGQLRMPSGSDFETVLVWASFTLVFGRYVFLGVYGSNLRVNLRKQAVELAASIRRVEELASRDELTKTLNRRSMLAILEQHLGAAQNHGQSFCVALFDLDNFKLINDRHGHLVGDRVLEAFARLTQSTMRSSDTFGRYGGEEFLAVLVGTTPELALSLIERVRVSVAAHDWSQIAPGLSVRVSAGLAGYRKGDSITSVTGRADRALYEAKDKGRDRVIVAR
jgi:diguanylate cyclase (GGDEF)-like protein